MFADLVRLEASKLVEVYGHGAVGVRADAVPVTVFAVVEVLVLVAQDGQLGAVRQFVLALLGGYRGGLDVLVCQREERDGHPDQLAHLGAPEAGAGNHDVRGDDAIGGLDAGYAAV